MKTDPKKWNSLPGSFDRLNTRQILYSDNEWGIPLMKKAPLGVVPKWLAPYRTRFRTKRKLDLSQGGYHFFIDSDKIKCVWERPQVAIKFMRKLPVVLSPNFELSGQRCEQLFAVYKNRWCGAWWQYCGLSVIPSISWGYPNSYDFCFSGIEPGGVVAISAESLHAYPNGFDEMVSRIDPVKILCLGEPPTCAPDIIVYPKRWDLRKIGLTSD